MLFRSATSTLHDLVRVTVSDTGPGLPQELADQLFDTRVTTKPGGTGLGLPVVRLIAESHGGGVGVVLDGCPPQLELDESDIQPDLDRRRPGQSKIVTPRDEADRVSILSGTFEGKTLGTPILMMVHNKDHRPEAYSEMKTKFRPSHADYTYQQKFVFRNWQGGGRSSARETIGRVAAGAVEIGRAHV